MTCYLLGIRFVRYIRGQWRDVCCGCGVECVFSDLGVLRLGFLIGGFGRRV